MQSVIRSLRPWKSVRGVLEVGIVNEEERRVHSRSRLINTRTRAWKTRRLETEYSNTSLTGFTCSSASCSSQDGSRTARGDRGRCDKSYDMDGYKVWFSPPGSSRSCRIPRLGCRALRGELGAFIFLPQTVASVRFLGRCVWMSMRTKSPV